MFIINLLTGPGSVLDKIAIIIGFLLAGLLAIVSHEVMHGYVALLNGDATAKERKRLSLNPAVHFEPVGAIMLLLVGFGWAKPVPINTLNFKNYKRGMLTVSIAGVAINVLFSGLLMLTLYLSIPLFYKFESNAILDFFNNFFLTFIVVGIKINLILAVFNFLPIYPLDGYNFLNTLLPRNNSFQQFMIKWGQIIIFAIIILGYVGRYTGLHWLDLFGSFNDLLTRLIENIIKRGLVDFVV